MAESETHPLTGMQKRIITSADCQQRIARAMEDYQRSLPNDTLHEPIHHLLSIEGKRLRPMLTLMGCSLFSDTIEEAVPAALAIEVFHNFTLMHDDIMDAAPLRRGSITVHEKWNTNRAILSGDAMFVASYQLLCKTASHILPQVLPVFNDTALGVCAGQQLDMDFEKRDVVSEAEYLEMIRLKTSVLLGGALQIGAIIGGASKEDQLHISEFGIDLGISFQLWDDYLDAYGEVELVGKQRGGDILADKKTFLYVSAYAAASPAQRDVFKELHDNPTIEPELKLTRTLSLFDELNVKEKVHEQMANYQREALRHLHAIQVPQENKEQLTLFAETIFKRRH